MADQRVYRLKLSPEEALTRIRSSEGPFEIRVVGWSFYLHDSGFFGASLKGTVRDEEGITCLDSRLSLHLVPTLIVAGFGMLVAQGAFHVVRRLASRSLTPRELVEEALGATGMAGIAAGLIYVAWRPRARRSAAYWGFLDQLFADVKVGEEQL